MTRASDEPIRPMPISAMRSNSGFSLMFSAVHELASASMTPRLASSEPMVMRSAFGRP